MNRQSYLTNFTQGFNPLGLLFAMILAALLMTLVAVVPASASTLPSNRPLPNEKLVFYGDATATQTFATTSYADLAAATFTFTPQVDPNAAPYYGAANNLNLLRITFTIDGSKATSTTGSCAVYINGAVVAATESFISSAAARGTIAGDYLLANTTTGSQTIKLQCRSGDTNTFTVNDAHLIVTEIW